jgi:hypothetical protein
VFEEFLAINIWDKEALPTPPPGTASLVRGKSDGMNFKALSYLLFVLSVTAMTVGGCVGSNAMSQSLSLPRSFRTGFSEISLIISGCVAGMRRWGREAEG